MQSTGSRWESCISILTSALIGVMWQMLCLQARYCYWIIDLQVGILQAEAIPLLLGLFERDGEYAVC